MTSIKVIYECPEFGMFLIVHEIYLIGLNILFLKRANFVLYLSTITHRLHFYNWVALLTLSCLWWACGV